MQTTKAASSFVFKQNSTKSICVSSDRESLQVPEKVLLLGIPNGDSLSLIT